MTSAQLNDHGASLERSGRIEQAIESYRDVVRVEPGFYQAWCNLGGALLKCDRMAEAADACREAIQIAPAYAEAHNVLGAAMLEQCEVERACGHFRDAIRHAPQYVEAHVNLAIGLLTLGDLTAGFSEYEWRRRHPAWKRPGLPWDGSDPFGKTLLLHSEGGMGDVIQFVRFAAMVADMGAQVILECHPPLKSLLRGAPGVWRLIASGEEVPHYDAYAPLASVPALLGMTWEDLPARTPYLSADAALIGQWKCELAKFPGFKVGIAWQAEQRTLYGRRRSVPLEEFAPLAQVAGVRLFSLQKDWTGDPGFPLTTFPNLDRVSGPFMDTAAIAKQLDLVVTVDTSIAHLAGALNVPVWIAKRFAPDWRWLLDREDSPWYPTAKLYRQCRPGGWAAVFDRMARDIDGRIKCG